MDNTGRLLISIFLLFTCLTFLFFLLNTAPLICAELPPLDPGNLPFSPLSGAYAPTGGRFFPQFGAPYGFPYQNTGQNTGLGFMPSAGQYGLPYQAPGFSSMPPFMPTGAPYGFPTQAPLYNISTPFPYASINPYIPTSTDTAGTNTTFPVYNTGYNPAAFPNQTFYGPVPNMYTLPNVTQPFPGVSAYDPTAITQGFINPAAGFTNAFVNPYAAPYGNMAPFQGAFSQQGYAGLPYQGYNPYQPLNPWQQTWSPFGTNINPYTPYSPYQPYNPSTYYPGTGGSGSSNNGNGGVATVDIPNIKGHWAGTWEAWLTDPNEGVITDPNGQIIVTMSGDIRFNITQQISDGGAILGKIEIKDWDVDPQPQSWPGNWTGESDEVILTGWIDTATRYLKARYYYYPGNEAFGDYDENEDYKNIIGLYTWVFNTNKLKITDTGVSGQFSITGTEDYYVIGVFSTAKYVP